MDNLVILLGVGVAGIVVFGALGSWIASQKGREPTEGLLLGGIFGPLGCLIEALLPSAPQRSYRERSEPTPSWLKEIPGEPDPASNWLRDLERKSR